MAGMVDDRGGAAAPPEFLFLGEEGEEGKDGEITGKRERMNERGSIKMRYEIDFSGAETSREMHRAIKEGLKLPEYYGNNLDALWDCLKGDIETPCEIWIKGMGGKNEMMTALLEAVFEMMERAAEQHGRRGREVKVSAQ